MRQGLSQVPEPVWLPHQVRVKRDAEHQRLLPTLTELLVEPVDHHVPEVPGAVLACRNGRDVVDLLRVRDAPERTARACPQLDRLVVVAPLRMSQRERERNWATSVWAKSEDSPRPKGLTFKV